MSNRSTRLNHMLRSARIRRGWSIEEASEAVGVSPRTFLRWEWGEREPHPFNLGNLCKVFNLSLEELGLYSAVEIPSEIVARIHIIPDFPTLHSDQLTAGMLQVIVSEEHLHAISKWMKVEFEDVRGLDTMKQQEDQITHALSRRQILKLIAGIPFASLAFTTGTNTLTPLTPEEALCFCESSISSCWRLYYEGGQSEVTKILPMYLSLLTTLTQESSTYQRIAASLASQTYQLACMIAWQQEDFGTALVFGKRGFQYGQIADDPNLQASSLIRQANPFLSRRFFKQALQIYQEALQYVDSVSPLLQGRIYSALAGIYANLGQKQEALRYMGLSHELNLELIETDPSFSYTRFGQYKLFFHDALAYLALTQYKNAWEAFEQSGEFLPKTLGHRRVELLVNQGRASVVLGNLEQSCTYVERAAKTALTIGSPLRFHQAHDTFQSMQIKWPYEQKVKALAELFNES